MKINSVIREPLVHFLLLGAALFVFSAFVEEPGPPAENRIVVSPGQIDSLVDAWTKTWSRPPTPDELSGLVRDHVREEVYYREALAMGLEKDDTIIRRRLRQKMEFLGESLVAEVQPTDEQLAAWFEENNERFRQDTLLTLDQIYFSEDRRGENAVADANAVLARLREGTLTAAETPGDSVMLPARFERASSRDVARALGEEFVAAIGELPVGEWSGPVRSGFGLHLVFIEEKSGGGLPALSDVREQVMREYTAEQRVTLNDRLYAELLKKYEVAVELPEWAGGGTVELQ